MFNMFISDRIFLVVKHNVFGRNYIILVAILVAK